MDVPMNYYHFEKVKQDVKLRSQSQEAGASGSKGKVASTRSAWHAVDGLSTGRVVWWYTGVRKK